MIEPGVRIWWRVPGYDSDSESDGVPEQLEKQGGDLSRLSLIREFLADRTLDAPIIGFSPVRLPKALSKADVKGKSTQRLGNKLQRHSSSHFAAQTLGAAIRAESGGGPVATFRVETTAPIVRDTCLANGLVAVPDQDFCLMWSGPGLRDHVFQDLHEFQRVNHFPGGSELTRKDCMSIHLNEMSKNFGADHFDFVPETFVMPDQAEEFLKAYAQQGGLWIVKPNNAACGRGIYIFKNLVKSPLSLADHAVVSRYIERPLLIQGLKFDLRIYVLVTQYEPLRAYVYREGLARFSSAPYSTDDEHLSDVYRHLTNYSINKNAPNFCENEELEHDNQGHKWSLSAYNKHLKCIGADVNLVWSRIMDLVVKTLLSAEPAIGNRTRKTTEHAGICFEMYGFDILVDAGLKPWIIEVNMSPSMQADSPLDWQIKSSLLTDALNMIGIYNPDFRTIRASRARTHILRARIAHRKMLQERGSFTGLYPNSRRRNSAKSERCVDKPMISDEPLILDTLSESCLKDLLRSFEEFQRCSNFIRLYPTLSTVNRYASITMSKTRRKTNQASLLATALFGPPLLFTQEKPTTKKRSSLNAEGTKPASDAPIPETEPGDQDEADTESQQAEETEDSDTAQQNESDADETPVSKAVEDAKQESIPAYVDQDVVQVVAKKSRTAKPKQIRKAIKVGGVLSPTRKVREAVAAATGVLAKVDEPVTYAKVVSPKTERATSAEGTFDPLGLATLNSDYVCNSPVDSDLDLFPVEENVGPADDSTENSEDDVDTTLPEEALTPKSAESNDVDAQRSPQDLKMLRQEVLSALLKLSGRDCWRLALVEYLSRIRSTCATMNSKDRAQLARCSAFARLSAFSRRLSAFREAWSKRNNSPGNGDVSSDQDSDLDTGHLVDEISLVCQTTIKNVCCGIWDLVLAADLRPRSAASTCSSERKLNRRTRDVPRYFSERLFENPKAKFILESIPGLNSDDLECLLQSPKCILDFPELREVFRDSTQPSTSPYSPLQDLTQSGCMKRTLSLPMLQGLFDGDASTSPARRGTVMLAERHRPHGTTDFPPKFGIKASTSKVKWPPPAFIGAPVRQRRLVGAALKASVVDLDLGRHSEGFIGALGTTGGRSF